MYRSTKREAKNLRDKCPEGTNTEKTNGEKILEKIKVIFKDIRSKYPWIEDEDLYKNGTIYYMNGNDGTDFDWDVNGHCCELYMYHQNEVGFIKVYVNVGDTYTAYVFPNGEMSATETIKGDLGEGESLYLATLLYLMTDKRGIYDAPITEIDFTYEPTKEELWEMNEAYEEPDDFFDWED